MCHKIVLLILALFIKALINIKKKYIDIIYD